MDWLQVLVLLGGNLAMILPLWLWSRGESRADYRHLENSTNANLKAIADEMKDFHGRLIKQDAEFKAGLLLLEERFLQIRGRQ